MAIPRAFIPLVLAVAALLIAATGSYGMVNSQSANGKYDADGDGLIEVSNLEQLNAIRYDMNGDGDSGFSEYHEAFPVSSGELVCASSCNGYELVRSLNFNDPRSYASGKVKIEWTTGSGWQPIGDSQSGFRAIFEGNRNTIKSLYINLGEEESGDFVGLLGVASKYSTINRVGIVDVDIKGLAFAGGLTGGNAGIIDGCYVTGSIAVKNRIPPSGQGYNPFYAGGLVGINNGTVRSSYAKVRVSGDNRIGGLVGHNTDPSGTIISSYASGTVSDRDSDSEFGESSTSIGDSIGGLVGENNGMISMSFATSEVTGDNKVGGLVGFALDGSIIDNSYATGKVRGHSAIGGLVGDNYGKISASYSLGIVQGDSMVGGLVGSSRQAEEPRVEFSYWDTNSSGIEGTNQEISYINDRFGEGKTKAEIQNPTRNIGIYSQWNPNIWDFGTSRQYPVLQFDVDGDGVASWWELGPQTGERPTPTPTPTATPAPTPTIRATAEVFGELVRAGLLVSVWRYHNATQSWDAYDPNVPAELNDLTHAAPEDIVWVEVMEETQFQGRTLHMGWNLISLK